MTDVQRDALLSWAIRQKTYIKILEAESRTRREILSLYDEGLLTDIEFIEVCIRMDGDG